MSRLFDDASNQRLDTTSSPVTAAPFTMAAWMRSDDLTINQIVMNIQDADIGDDYWRMVAMGNVTNDPIHIRVEDAPPPGADSASTTPSGYSANVWHHVCVVEASASDRRAYIDGGSEGTDIASAAPSGITKLTVGGRFNAGYMSGNIGHPALWDVALTLQEIASLANGVSPLRLRRGSLVGYWPINGQSPEYNVIGTGENLVLVSTPTVDEEPPIPWGIVAPG